MSQVPLTPIDDCRKCLWRHIRRDAKLLRHRLAEIDRHAGITGCVWSTRRAAGRTDRNPPPAACRSAHFVFQRVGAGGVVV